MELIQSPLLPVMQEGAPETSYREKAGIYLLSKHLRTDPCDMALGMKLNVWGEDWFSFMGSF